MNWLALRLLALTDWSSLRVSMGAATHVPSAVERLAHARSPEEAEQAYWLLDNHVVVQENVFEAALPLVPVLLAMLAEELPPWVHERVLDLLLEIGIGEEHAAEAAAGNTELGMRCRMAVAEGIWVYYRALLNADEKVRETRSGC